MAVHRILVCGLPGAGKTTFAQELVALLTSARFTVEHFNADEVRKTANDWDFSPEGRNRQASRMGKLASASTADVAIMDFVAPMVHHRKDANPTLTVWMNTITQGRFEDTNKVFEQPTSVDLTVSEFSPIYAAGIVNRLIEDRQFDWTRPTTQLLGRYQPWHAGHRALFLKALEKTGQVAIMVRGMAPDTKNPFDFRQVQSNIDADLKSLYNGLYVVMYVPNITHITYGRDVGYKIEQEHLGADVEAISATNIRNGSIKS